MHGSIYCDLLQPFIGQQLSALASGTPSINPFAHKNDPPPPSPPPPQQHTHTHTQPPKQKELTVLCRQRKPGEALALGKQTHVCRVTSFAPPMQWMLACEQDHKASVIYRFDKLQVRLTNITACLISVCTPADAKLKPAILWSSTDSARHLFCQLSTVACVACYLFFI